MDRLGRVLEWLDVVAAGRASSTVDVPGGRAYLQRDYPVAHNQNFVRLTRDEGLDAAEIDRIVREVFAGTEVDHRVIEVYDLDLAARVTPGLQELGYEPATDLILDHPHLTPTSTVHSTVHNADTADTADTSDTSRSNVTEPGGAAPTSPALTPAPAPTPAGRVVEISVDERAEVATRWREDENPAWPKSWAQQLGDRIRSIVPVAECTFLAVKDENGAIVSRADLFRRAGLAQVEEVVTLPTARNQGHASALVREAMRRAGTDDIFIIADADDWPAQLYRRLGFEDLGRTALFVNAPTD